MCIPKPPKIPTPAAPPGPPVQAADQIALGAASARKPVGPVGRRALVIPSSINVGAGTAAGLNTGG